MNTTNTTYSADCAPTAPLLGDYMENGLSARQMLAVEKHLTACPACAEQLRQLQATVQILQTTPRFDTGDDFMAKLHARLDTVAPEPARRRSFADALRDSWAGMGEVTRSARVPAFGLSLGLAAIALTLLVNRPAISPVPMPPPISSAVAVETPQGRVAEVAGNPLADPAAESLGGRSTLGDADGQVPPTF